MLVVLFYRRSMSIIQLIILLVQYLAICRSTIKRRVTISVCVQMLFLEGKLISNSVISWCDNISDVNNSGLQVLVDIQTVDRDIYSI